MPNVRVHNKTSIINDEKYSMHTLQPHAMTRPLHAWFRCMLNIILCIDRAWCTLCFLAGKVHLSSLQV